jgi:hypothetical protein
VFELAHVIVRPVSTLPVPSRRVAVACVPCPIIKIGDARVTVIVATGAGGGAGVAVTLTVAEPEIPSLSTVIVVEPAATAETMPDGDTVATAVFELDQLTVRPERMFPAASFGVT